jgi:hypothetical protein
MLVEDFESIKRELDRVRKEKAEMVTGEAEAVPDIDTVYPSWAQYFAPCDDGA